MLMKTIDLMPKKSVQEADNEAVTEGNDNEAT